MDNILEVTGLAKHFTNAVALKDVSFNVKKNQIVGLVGENGAGKSTIMRAVLGLTSIDDGTIKFEDEIISPINQPKLSQMGSLVDHPAIFPYMTGLEHLKLFASGKDAARNIDRTIAELKMADYIAEKTQYYSLGMKQKLGIGLALVNQPKLIVLDEPFNGLDPAMRDDLVDLMHQKAHAGTAILLSSHDIDELDQLANVVYEVKQGRVNQKDMNSLKNAYVLQTSNDLVAKQILEKEQINVLASNMLLIRSDDRQNLAKALKVLIDANIDVMDVRHE